MASNPITTIVPNLDGNRTSLSQMANGSNVVTSYGYDADNRLKSESFTAGPNNTNLGNLSPAYDADDRLISDTGTLASLKLPASTTNNPVTYTSTNQIETWNGTASTYDSASNLLTDPSQSSTTSLTWDERNLLSNVSGPATFSLQHDAKGRRENDTENNTITNYYVDDQSTVVLGDNVNGSSNTPSTYQTLPDSGEVVSYTAGSSKSVPIHDYLGSTIGLVGSSNTLQTQWSYSPTGTPTLSGSSSPFPFLADGMQYDPTGYYDDHSPLLAHSLSGGDVAYIGQAGSGSGGMIAGPPRVVHGAANYSDFGDVDFNSDEDAGSEGNGGISVSLGPLALIAGLEDLLSGASHPYMPRPSTFAARHPVVCDHMGVPSTICVSQADDGDPCVGFARELKERSGLIGSPTAFPGERNQWDTAGVVPEQFGPYVNGGQMASAGLGHSAIKGWAGSYRFHVGTVIAGRSPIPGMNVRDALRASNPRSVLILEIPGIPKDLGIVPVVVWMPTGFPCPEGTCSASFVD